MSGCDREQGTHYQCDCMRERMARLEEQLYGYQMEMMEIHAILAEGLGYPYDEDYGWLTGDHTGVTLAMEVLHRKDGEIQALEIAFEAAKSVMNRDVLAEFHEILRDKRNQARNGVSHRERGGM